MPDRDSSKDVTRSPELEGYIAFTGGKLKEDCPYSSSSLESEWWEQGWEKGQREAAIEKDIDIYNPNEDI